MSIFVFQLFNSNEKDFNVVSGGKYDVVIRRERERERKQAEHDDDMSLLVRIWN